MSKKKDYRSAVTGLFVSQANATGDPNQTISEQHLEQPKYLSKFVLVTKRHSKNKVSMSYFDTLKALKVRLNRFKKSDIVLLTAYRVLYNNLQLSKTPITPAPVTPAPVIPIDEDADDMCTWDDALPPAEPTDAQNLAAAQERDSAKQKIAVDEKSEKDRVQRVKNRIKNKKRWSDEHQEESVAATDRREAKDIEDAKLIAEKVAENKEGC